MNVARQSSAAPRGSAAGVALAWLSHPLTVLALVTLVLNDHVLKAAFPGWWTGKLSDVAGLVLAPPLVALLLAMLAPKAGSAPVALITTGVLLPLALLGVAATSPADIPSVTHVTSVDGRLHAYVANEHSAYQHWLVSADGVSWSDAGPGGESAIGPPQTQACAVDALRCYRVVAGHYRVERDAMAGGRADAGFSSRAVAVWNAPDGRHSVAVANGRDGLLMRDFDGTWTRVGFGESDYAARNPLPVPKAVETDEPVFDLVGAIGLLLVLAASTAALGTWRMGSHAGSSLAGWSSIVLALVLPVQLALVAVDVGTSILFPILYLLAALTPLTAVVVAGVHLCVVAARPGVPGRWGLLVGLGVLVTVSLGGAVLLARINGVIDSNPVAVGLGGLAALPGIAVALSAGRPTGESQDPPVPRTWSDRDAARF
jgi:hypothetical protein